MILSLSHIYKSYSGKTVLSDLSLQVNPGDFIVLTGPSGIGKTTLLRILLGLETADRGSVERQKNLHIGAVFQEDRLLQDFSAADNVSLAAPSLKKDEIRRELEILLPKGSSEKPVSALSGGMKRRVCIVRAMILPKQLYVLDEPFAGLDAQNREKSLSYIRQRRRRAAVILSAHSPCGLENERIITLPAPSVV